MELPIFNTYINFSRHHFCCFTVAPLFVLDKSTAWNRCPQHPCFKNLCKVAQASKNSNSNAQHFLLDLLTHSWFHSMLFALPGYQFPSTIMNRCFYLKSCMPIGVLCFSFLSFLFFYLGVKCQKLAKILCQKYTLHWLTWSNSMEINLPCVTGMTDAWGGESPPATCRFGNKRSHKFPPELTLAHLVWCGGYRSLLAIGNALGNPSLSEKGGAAIWIGLELGLKWGPMLATLWDPRGSLSFPYTFVGLVGIINMA
jgi:hypothetical protein